MASEPTVTYQTKDIKFTLRSADYNVMPIDLNIAVAYGDEDLGYYNPDANLTYDGNSYNSKNNPPIEFSTTKRGSVEKIFIFDRIELNYILNFKEPKQNVIIKKVSESPINHKIYFNSSSSEETPIWTEVVENTTYPISFDSSFDVTDGFVLGNWRQFKVVYTDNNNDFFDFITSVEYIDDLGNNLTMFEINFKRTELEVTHVYLQDIDNLRTNLTSNLTLTQDLDFNDDASYNHSDPDWQAKKLAWTTGEGWMPIGYNDIHNNEFHYKGIFDGDGHSIKNLYINYTIDSEIIPNIGLFGVVSSDDYVNQVRFKNLSLIDATVIGDNITLEYNKPSIGIICGTAYFTSILNCHTSGSIIINGVNDYIGGIIGSIIGNATQSSANVSIQGTSTSIVGGIAGKSANGILNVNNYTHGSIVNASKAGGLFGVIGGNGYGSVAVVKNSYAAMSISSTGGGGIIGSIAMTIDDDFNEVPFGTDIIQCYYNSTLCGFSDTGKGTPKTTVEMKQQATYTGWDFNSIWQINESVDYPKFRTEAVSDYISKWNMAGFTDVKGVNNLNDIGGITFGTGVRGDASSAMVFSGSDSVHFSNNDIILKNDEPFTITGWVYVEDFIHPFQNILNLKTEKSYGLTIAVSSYPAYKGISVNNVEDCLSGQMNNIAFVEKTWTFIAVSSSSCLGSFDFEITTNEYTKKPTELSGGFPVVTNSNGFSVASSSDYGFKGKLQNFRYYKRVLTTAEKTEIYNYERLT